VHHVFVIRHGTLFAYTLAIGEGAGRLWPWRSVLSKESITWKGEYHMQWIQRHMVALLVAAPLALGFAGPAAAQLQISDGLVNVTIGDIEVLNNANIGVAAQVAATVCGVKVSNVAVLAEIVDRSGTSRTVCDTDQGPVVISQN
jgi:hypothetical protein